ncbi:MAG: hypothetical protein SGILL_007462, partial [Bacillariaceae sp.]
MPSRAIRYMPSGATGVAVVDNELQEAPPASDPKINDSNVVSDDEDTFESLDRIGPLVPHGGEADVEDAFAEEDITNGDVTVLDDDDNDEDDNDNGNDSSYDSDSSEEAFIEVNHDDCSVVSEMTVETALQKKSRKKKKKKSKKNKGRKSSRRAAAIPESI